MSQLLSGHLPPWVANIFWGLKQMLIAAGVVVAGALLGYLMTSPHMELTISIIGILIHLLIILVNPLSGLLFWFIFYPFSERVVNIPLPAGIPDLSPTRFVMAFLAIMILGQVAIRKRTWPSFTKVEWAIIGFMVAIILSTLSAPDPLLGIQIVLDNYLVPLILYFLIKNLITNRESLDKALKTLLVIGAYAAVYIIFEQTTSYIIAFGKPPEQLITVKYFYRGYTESLRLADVKLLEGIAVVGQVLTMSIPFAFYYLFKTPSPFKKIWYVLLIGVMFIGLFYTYKRAAYFSVPISFLVIQFFYPQFRRIFWVIVVVFGLLLIVTWNQVNRSALVTERLDQGELETGNGRTDIWAETIDLWKQRPLFGWGFKQTEKIRNDKATENFYLMLLASAGLAGLIPYISMLIFTLIDSINLYRKAGIDSHLFVDRNLIAVFWGSALTYILKSFSGNQGNLIANAFFMLLLGAVIGAQVSILAKINEQKQSELNG